MKAIPSRARAGHLGAFGIIALVAVASPVLADVTITSKQSSEGLGGFGNTNSTSTRIVAKDRAVNEDESEYTGRFKTFAGGKQKSTQIVRLDRGVIWSVDADKQQYSEMTFEQMREVMNRATAEMKKASAQMEQAKLDAAREAKDADVTMTFDTDVKHTGARQAIAGLPCEQVVITSISKAKDAKTGAEGGSLKFTVDGWYSKEMPGGSDVLAFDRAYAEKLGLDQFARQFSPAASAMYGDAMKEMAKKLEGLGYPLKSTFTVENVQSEETRKQMAEARAAQKHAQAESEQQGKKAESEQDAADAAGIATSDGDGLKGKLGGFLGRKLANKASKKVQEKATAQADKAAEGADSGILLRSTTEVVSISSSPAAAARFEVPAGYKKVEAKMAGAEK